MIWNLWKICKFQNFGFMDTSFVVNTVPTLASTVRQSFLSLCFSCFFYLPRCTLCWRDVYLHTSLTQWMPCKTASLMHRYHQNIRSVRASLSVSFVLYILKCLSTNLCTRFLSINTELFSGVFNICLNRHELAICHKKIVADNEVRTFENIEVSALID